METRTSHRLVAGLALAVGLLCGLLAWRWNWFIDLRVYELGAGALFGGDLYGVRFHVANLPFTYPPFAAVLMLPLAVLPIWLSAFVWAVACVVVLAFVVDLVLRACGAAPRACLPSPRLLRDVSDPIWRRWRRSKGDPARLRSAALPDRPETPLATPPTWETRPSGLVLPGVVAVALASEPVWSTFSFGQVNLFLMAAILADVLRPDRRYAGWLVGIVAGIKLTPLFFVAFFVVIGRRRAAGTAVASFAGTVLVGAVAAPGASWAYWTEVLWDPGRVGGVEYAGNQSVLGILSRLLGHEAPTALWFVVAGTTAAVALASAALLWRSESPAARPLAACTAAYGMLLASPISWDHHWVWLVPTGIALWHSGLPRARVVAGIVAVVAFSRAIWWSPFRYGREYDWSFAEGIVGNAYVLTALGLLVSCAWWGLRARPVSDDPGPDASGADDSGVRRGVRRLLA